MKILLVTTHLNFGGIASYTASLAKGLSRRGHKVFVASGGGDFARKLNEDGIAHIRLPVFTKSELSPKVFISALILSGFVRRESVDIMHAHTRVTQIASSIASKLTGVPYVTTCHGFFKKRIGRRLFGAWGKRVIAISEAVREHLVNDFKIKKSGIELVYNGIDLKAVKDYSEGERAQIKRGLGFEGGPVVGVIARLSPVKGHRYLIEAMKLVLEKIPDAKLLIIGNGKIKNELVALSQSLGISSSVHFLDSVFDTPKYLSIMDVFALPSVQEGLGLSTIEALAVKRAVIASDVGGIYSVVRDHSTGLLVPPREPKALADAILKLFYDEPLRRKYGNQGRRLVEEKFSLDLMVEKVERIYKMTVVHPSCRGAQPIAKKKGGEEVSRNRTRLGVICVFIFLVVLGAGYIFLRSQYVVPILMYHAVDGQYNETKLSVSPESFRRQMKFLRDHRYNVLTLREVVDVIKRKEPFPPKSVAITFDDGYENNYTNAFPAIKEYSIPVTVFVVANNIGKPGYMGWGQIREMTESGLVSIGSHTMTHRYLPSIEDEGRLAREILNPGLILKKKLDQEDIFFSYPVGGFTEKIRNMVEGYGYAGACATNPGGQYHDNDIFALKRVRISRTSDNMAVFWIESSGYYTLIKEIRDED